MQQVSNTEMDLTRHAGDIMAWNEPRTAYIIVSIHFFLLNKVKSMVTVGQILCEMSYAAFK